MVVGIDIDDTICKTRELQTVYWKEYYNDNPNDEYTEELPFNINHFGYDYINVFWDTYRSRLFSPELKEDVIDIINKYRELGFKFVIVTSRPPENYVHLNQDIKDWFNRVGLKVDDIFTGVYEKAKFCLDNNIDMLIDDDIRHIDLCKNLSVNYIHMTPDMIWKRIDEILNNYL